MGSSESDLNFSADLFTLSKEYFDIVMHIRKTNIFKERTQKLQKLVQKYLQNYKKFDKTNLDLLAIDTSHKLHPRDYGTSKVNKEYLINACLRQQDFCRKIHVKCITFQDCLKGYKNFLMVVKSRSQKITVPSLMEDFMWHSHMRDHENYVKDMKKILGFVLNHNDEIPKQNLKSYWDDALTKRNQIYGQKFKKYQIQPNKNKQNHQITSKRNSTKTN